MGSSKLQVATAYRSCLGRHCICEHALAVRKTYAVTPILLQLCNVFRSVFQHLPQFLQPFVRLAGACIYPKCWWQAAFGPKHAPNLQAL